MPDYKQGKIYMIIDVDGRIRYYGSTTLTLMERWWAHKSNFNTWKKGSGSSCAIYKYFDKHGIDNFRIELVEDYPCDNDEQLRMKEDEYIRENECVNEQRAYTTYEEKLEKYRQYHHADKARHNEISRQWYQDHKEHKHEYDKQYRKSNIEAIREKKRIQIVCECGAEVIKDNLSRHRKTAVHLSRI
jgi:hypothetical protein